jgi:hypothetical protein
VEFDYDTARRAEQINRSQTADGIAIVDFA